MLPLDIALSPCPNDTLVFYAWIKGIVGKELQIQPHFADIEKLNEWAFKGRYPLTKLSFATLKQVQHLYSLLPVGAAIGKGVGPIVVSKEPLTPNDLSHSVVALPGEWTTATLLYSHLLPEPQKRLYCRYDEIFSLLEEGAIDAGVLIHESRFTYEELGFHLVVDLGKLWEEEKGCGVPLGCLAIRKDVEELLRPQVITTLEASIDYGKKHPQQALPYILDKARETAPDVVQKHIDLYVNEETKKLSPSSQKAIDILISL
jgi:1,4-dihydroxy-6-naphthoate synthase